MKQLFLLFAFVGLVTFTTNAQNCSSSKSASVEKATCSKTAAAKAASLSEDIEERVCAKSGKVSYVKKEVCPMSGKASFSDVEFCSKSGKFINASPSKVGTKKGACTKPCTKETGAKATKVSSEMTKPACAKGAANKSCCASKAGATKTAAATKVATTKKACCAKGGDKASCTGAKGAKVEATDDGAKVKLVKSEN